jgi:hypothetical protein
VYSVVKTIDRPPDEGVGGGVAALLTAHHYRLVRTTCTEITLYTDKKGNKIFLIY